MFEHGFEHGFENGFEHSFEHSFEHGFEHAFEHELKSEHQSYFHEEIQELQFLYYLFFSKLVLDFILRSSFIRVNVSNSNKISKYTSSEMESSDNAFEMRLLILLKQLQSTFFHVFLFSTTYF